MDGRLVALPWFVDLGLLYYRSDLLDAAAIPVPPTWPVLEDAAMRIQDMKRGGGESRFWGFVWQGAGGESLSCNVVEWVASWNGGGIVERSGRVSVDNPRAAYALERAARWMGLISPESVLADAEAETLARFAAGNAAFMRHWPYAWQELQSADSPVRGNVGVALLPKGGVEGRHAATLGGWQLAVSRYSRHPDEAADLVRYLTSVPVQRARAVGHGYLPTRTELPSEPTVLATSPIMRLLGPDSDVVFAVRPSSVTGAWYPEVSQRLQGAALQVLMADLDAEMATASLADARRQRVAFTRPYYVSPARFVSRRGAFADVDPATLKGKRIGVRRGTTFDDYVTDNYAPYAEILRYPTQLGALLDLVLERIDLVIGDQLVLHQTFLATPQGQDYEFVVPLLSEPVWFGAGNAVAVAKNDRGLRTLLDRAVADIHVNGVFERIQRAWFSRDIRGPEK